MSQHNIPANYAMQYLLELEVSTDCFKTMNRNESPFPLPRFENVNLNLGNTTSP